MAVMTRTGERRIWEYHNTLRTEGVASPIVRGMAHDVTEQKRTERLLREASEDLLSKVRENERTIRELKLFRTLVDQCTTPLKWWTRRRFAFSMSMRKPARPSATAAKNFWRWEFSTLIPRLPRLRRQRL